MKRVDNEDSGLYNDPRPTGCRSGRDEGMRIVKEASERKNEILDAANAQLEAYMAAK